MASTHDWESVFGQVEHALEQRRAALKSELDGVWAADAARANDVLVRMLAASERLQLLSGLRERFLAAARASRVLETEVDEVHGRLERVLSGLSDFRAARDLLQEEELRKLAALFAEELGKESVVIDFGRFSSEDIESLKRVLDRSKSRLATGGASVPLDLGERGFEGRPSPADDVILSSEPVIPLREIPIDQAVASAGLAEELEEETGILLADEVVDMEPTPAATPAPEAKKPAEDDDEVVFVDDGS
ncbi:MAG: hypothetical protein HYY25_05650 [Candidatus Wallbacteria bacterium]|nr:hypothetical protein [Candidatus Wallbacteria bacterium]